MTRTGKTVSPSLVCRGCLDMTLTELFTYLGAPLANSRWSWGAVRPDDSAIFLRVWQDEQRKVDGRWYTCVSDCQPVATKPIQLGSAERNQHVDLIRGGAPSYLVMCRARDKTAQPRAVADFDRNDVFVGGRLVDLDGNWWLERTARKPISAVRLRPAG
jgi:hypothetical protein